MAASPGEIRDRALHHRGHGEPPQPPIAGVGAILPPQFFSEDFLSDDYDWRMHTWRKLRNMGCVLVIDVLSLFHPKLQAFLLQSGFSTCETISIVVLSPIQSEQLKIEPI